MHLWRSAAKTDSRHKQNISAPCGIEPQASQLTAERSTPTELQSQGGEVGAATPVGDAGNRTPIRRSTSARTTVIRHLQGGEEVVGCGGLGGVVVCVCDCVCVCMSVCVRMQDSDDKHIRR
jgi:hypothetical protein